MNIAIIGASGAIGSALVNQLSSDSSNTIYAFSRSGAHFDAANVHTSKLDLTDEHSIEQAASLASEHGPLDLVIVTTGILHEGGIAPEKSLRDLSADKFAKLFAINTTGPALVAKHFLPQLQKDERAVFAAISARVGSISDNYLGGWYAYRASKAALNMVIKNASIEMARCYKQAVVIGLHPGTVDSELSKPFQGAVPEGKLFTPEHSASKLLEVVGNVTAQDTGKCFAYDSSVIEG